MTITYYPEMLQGSEEWFEVRRGIITASEMKNVITPKELKPCKSRDGGESDYLYELMHQRINGFIEPGYISNDMLRGIDDEPFAKAVYHEKVAPVKDCGFVVNDKWGFKIGCSPDWLVSDDGGSECKSRKGSIQMRTIMENKVPADAMLQIQTSLLVTERSFWDYTSYCGGARMKIIKVRPDKTIQDAILTAANALEIRLQAMVAEYEAMVASDKLLIPTERRLPAEDILINSGE